MKSKRKSLIVIAMLLLLALVVCMCSVTFAKYVSSTGKQEANATVAKWGFVLNVDAENLFGKNYGAATDKLSVATGDTAGINVKSDAVVVAPGTTGSISFSIVGKAEVPAKLVVNAETENDVYLKKGTEVYNPIKWTLTENDVVIADGTLAQVIDKVNALAIIDIGTELENEYVLTWAWAFDGQKDEYDTILGAYANGTALPSDCEANVTMDLNLSVSIEQTQK